MIVLTVSKCSMSLKGDVTKWLMEIGSGVFVGKLSARVRDLLWERVCSHCGSGEATMVFSARNEQGFSVYVHNTVWKPIDFDGLVLMEKPLPIPVCRSKPSGPKRTKTSGKQMNCLDISLDILNGTAGVPCEFVAIDIETTGLKSQTDSIIEIAAVKYKDRKIVAQFQSLVRTEQNVPEEIVQLTGIGNDVLLSEGKQLSEVLAEFAYFIGDSILIGQYIQFDMRFLKRDCSLVNVNLKSHRIVDTVTIAKNRCEAPLENYRLETLVKKLGIAQKQEHRALPDAVLAAELFLKLMNN